MLKQCQTHVVPGETIQSMLTVPALYSIQTSWAEVWVPTPVRIIFRFWLFCTLLELFSHLYHLHRTNLEKWHGFHTIFACDICGCIWSHRLSNAWLCWKVKLRCHAAIAFQRVQCLSSLQTVPGNTKCPPNNMLLLHPQISTQGQSETLRPHHWLWPMAVTCQVAACTTLGMPWSLPTSEHILV